jgi:hypothetical protein
MASGNRTRKVSTAGSAGMTTVILNRVRVRNLMAKTIRESSVHGRHSRGPERQPDGGVILELNKANIRSAGKSLSNSFKSPSSISSPFSTVFGDVWNPPLTFPNTCFGRIAMEGSRLRLPEASQTRPGAASSGMCTAKSSTSNRPVGFPMSKAA